jgi:hypothetical protein
MEGLEAERLGGGAPDGISQVHAELVAEDRHLVDQRDVDVPVGILQQLGHLRLARGPGPDHLVAELAVEPLRGIGAGRGLPADDLGVLRMQKSGFPGSIRSGKKASEKSVPAVSPEAFSSSGRTTSSVVPG